MPLGQPVSLDLYNSCISFNLNTTTWSTKGEKEKFHKTASRSLIEHGQEQQDYQIFKKMFRETKELENIPLQQ